MKLRPDQPLTAVAMEISTILIVALDYARVADVDYPGWVWVLSGLGVVASTALAIWEAKRQKAPE